MLQFYSVTILNVTILQPYTVTMLQYYNLKSDNVTV